MVDVAALEQEHSHCGEEGTLQQRNDVEGREHYHQNHNRGRDERIYADIGHLVRVEEAEVILQGRGIDINVLRTKEQQRVASPQHHLSRSLLDALATSGYCCQRQIVFFLKRTAANGLAYQAAAEIDIGCTQLAARV